MTEFLFQVDSKIKEFESKVVSIDPETNGVVLEATAFYPGGGGQPADFGELIGQGGTVYKITKVKKNGGEVVHYVDGDSLPVVGDIVTGKIDWEHRYQLMRTHTALHILCGVIWRDYGVQVTGGNMDPLKGRLDFEFEDFNKDLISEIEVKINAEVAAARDIRVAILPREEAFQIPDLIRTKINLLPEGIKEVRTIELVGLDLQADGGTHVQNTSEVGKLRISDYKSKGKANKRIYVELEE